jgi:hypothetical protein
MTGAVAFMDRALRRTGSTGTPSMVAAGRRRHDRGARASGEPIRPVGDPVRAAAEIGEVIRSPGSPLAPGLCADMQRRLGHDFRHVRIHTDDGAARAASAIGARAFTAGPHVAFAQGEFRPQLSEGRRVLAHELAHVAQAGREPGGGGPRDRGGASVTPSGAGEHDAASRAAAAVNGVPAGGSGRDTGRTGGPAGRVERLERPGRDQRLDAYLDERGRLEIIPADRMDVGRADPAFLLRPAEAGDAIVAGPGRHGPEHHLGRDEVPEQLRPALRETARGMTPARQVLRVPACAELSVPGAGRFLTFDEYRAAHGEDRDMLPLPRALFEIAVARCGRPAEIAAAATPDGRSRPGDEGRPADGPPGLPAGASLALTETEAET